MVKINFDVKKHKLDNGLEVITINKDTQISSINIGIKVGALNETLEEKGISHFIEHMIFKGTENRTFQRLNDELESLGGEYNAYTDYSQTVYSISCLEEEFINGIELLSDMLINSKLPEEEVDKERGVILAEIRSSKDSVEDFSFKRINEVAFEHSALKYDVAGLDENVKNFTRDQLYSYYKKYYVPNNSLITMVSSREHDDAIKEIEKYFGKWQPKEVKSLDVKDEKNKDIKVVTTKENIELSTIIYLFTFYDLDKNVIYYAKYGKSKIREKECCCWNQDKIKQEGELFQYVKNTYRYAGFLDITPYDVRGVGFYIGRVIIPELIPLYLPSSIPQKHPRFQEYEVINYDPHPMP